MKGKVRIVIGISGLAFVLGGIRYWRSFHSAVPSAPIGENAGVQPEAAASAVQPTVAKPAQLETVGKFVKMSVQERNLEVNKLRGLKSTQLFAKWVDADRVDHDRLEQSLVGAILARSLRIHTTDTDDCYSEMSKFLADKANSEKDRSLLLWVMGQTATPQALELLIATASVPQRTDSSGVALDQIEAAALEQWGGRFHVELSPVLEEAWRKNTIVDDYPTIALAIATIGSPDGVSILLDAAVNGPKNDFKTRSAVEALSRVTNPNAVPTLAGALASQAGANETSSLIGNTLAGMPTGASTSALLGWLENADSTAAPLAEAFVMKSTTDASIAIWESASSNSITFRNQANRIAIKRGLDNYYKSRRSSL